MPIEVDKVVGAVIPGAVSEWDEDAVNLYHLGVGAGVPPSRSTGCTHGTSACSNRGSPAPDRSSP